MHRLMLFRHAKAERADPGMRDLTRALIERGRTDAKTIGVYMASHALIPDCVVMSPSTRTKETWACAGPAFRKAPALHLADALYDATPRDILDVVKATPAEAKTVLLIGHNPGLHEAALLLIASGDIGTRERLREGFPTSGLAVIDFAFDDWGMIHSQSGRLERFVSPKSLRAPED